MLVVDGSSDGEEGSFATSTVPGRSCAVMQGEASGEDLKERHELALERKSNPDGDGKGKGEEGAETMKDGILTLSMSLSVSISLPENPSRLLSPSIEKSSISESSESSSVSSLICM